MKKRVNGFTLVELIVVIAIIGVLASILVPSMMGYIKKANQTSANSTARTIYEQMYMSVIEVEGLGITSADDKIALSEKSGITGNLGDCVDLKQWLSGTSLAEALNCEGYIDIYYEEGHPVSVAWSKSSDDSAIIGRYPDAISVENSVTWENWDDDLRNP